MTQNSPLARYHTARGTMLLDALIIVAVVIALWFMWVAVGGPQKFKEKEESLFLAETPDNTSTPSTSEQSSLSKTTMSPADNTQTGNAPYAQYISLAVNAPGGDANAEHVILRVSPDTPSPVSITGWTLTSTALRRTVTIEQGTETPLRGQIPALTNISLAPGQRAILSTGRSPVGSSFLSNICSGYLSDTQSFTPPLPRACPSAADTARTHRLSDTACLSYLSGIPRCTDGISSIGSAPSSACAAFIERYVSYNGCVATYEKRPGFSTGEWRIYFGRMFPLWWKTDTVTLKDAEGRFVSSITF